MPSLTQPRSRYTRRPGSRPCARAPYGYKRDGSGAFVQDGDTWPVVEHIVRWYGSGSSGRAIAEGLNADGVPGPAGGKWNGVTVWTIAKRERHD